VSFPCREGEVPCETCGHPTISAATARCNVCWQVESGLTSYLRDGGDKAKAFIVDALIATIPGKPGLVSALEPKSLDECWRLAGNVATLGLGGVQSQQEAFGRIVAGRALGLSAAESLGTAAESLR
jgi:hypothetical protein